MKRGEELADIFMLVFPAAHTGPDQFLIGSPNLRSLPHLVGRELAPVQQQIILSALLNLIENIFRYDFADARYALMKFDFNADYSFAIAV